MSAKLQTNADARAMRTTKFPPEFHERVDVKKINLSVIKIWVQDEVLKILGAEDDVVTEMIFDMLQNEKSPNIKLLQTSLAGFLDKEAPQFCQKLWNMCLSAQKDPNGIPEALLEAKKQQMIKDAEAREQEREQATQRQAEERARDRELAHIRDRERGQRNRGGRGGGRGRERDRSPDRHPSSRDSRSPPPRRRDPPRGLDSYVPGGRGRRDNPAPRRRRRSPSYGRSPSRSRSPPRRRRRHGSSPGVSRSPPRRRSFADGSEDDQDRNGRKASRKERSLSPRRRRSPGMSISRSPPRRRRHASPSRSRSPRRYGDSSSRSPPPKRRNRRDSNDLMSRTDRPRDSRRLSRDGSSFSGSIDAGAEETHNNPNRRGPISKFELNRKLQEERMLYRLRRRDSAMSMPPPQGLPPFAPQVSFPPSRGYPSPGYCQHGPPPGFPPAREDTDLPPFARGSRGSHSGAHGSSR